MRNAFSEAITRLATDNEKIILLSGDIGNRLFDKFKMIAKNRFYNCGVAEANMTGVAAGLAMMGFHSVTYSITPFVTLRCLEQIRDDICYHNVPVTIVGTGAGLSYASLGPTHHSCDDIGFLRLLPNITILCPCDVFEVHAAINAAVKSDTPVYIRLGKKGEPKIHEKMPEFKIGEPITVRQGNDVCILSTGNMMSVALEVASQLHAEKNITACVESFHTIKPLNTEFLEKIFNKYAIVSTIEEHSLVGGLGGSIAEWYVDQGIEKTRLIRFGTQDKFMTRVGDQSYARSYFNLTSQEITKRLLLLFDK